VGLTSWFLRQEKRRLASFGEWLNLALGIGLTGLSLVTVAGRSLNLLLSTGTLAYLVHSRPLRVPLIYFTHGLGLLTVISWIDWGFPSLKSSQWGYVIVLLTAGEWFNSLRYKIPSRRHKKQWWFLSSWHFGFILAMASFLVFLSSFGTYFATGNRQPAVLAWLFVPSCLTGIAILTERKRRRKAALFSSYSFVIAQFLTLWQPGIRLIGLAVAAGVMILNSFYYKHPLTARLPLQLILILGISWIFEQWLTSSHVVEALFSPQWGLFDGIYLSLLWLLSDWLKRKNGRIASVYSLASEQVADVLCISEIIRSSLHAYLVTIGELNTTWQWILISILIAVSLVYRFWRKPREITVYGLLLAIEIFVIESVFNLRGTALFISLINLFLAFISLASTRWLFARFPDLTRLNSLRISPLLFAGMVVIWRLGDFTAYTGLLTLGVSIIGLCVSNRFSQNKSLTYLSLVGFSIAFNEIFIYQLWKNINFLLVNELISLSLVQIGIAFIYRLLIWERRRKDWVSIPHISSNILERFADGHWMIASLFKLSGWSLAALLGHLFAPNLWLHGCSLLVPTYALLKARCPQTKDNWNYLGFTDIYITAIFTRWIWTELKILDPHFASIAVGIALLIYHLPWQAWGWNHQPWRKIAYLLPLLTAILTVARISDLSLLSTAIFYIYLAIIQNNLRWSYVGGVALNWLAFRLFDRYNLTDILYSTSTIGLSLLYLAQVEPQLRDPEARKTRHYLRILGSGIINVTALVFHQETGLTPGIISLLTLLIGLGLKIRAFLLVGTITFILTVFYQLVVQSLKYTLFKWFIGLAVGILLITIAANFERRREQILSLLRNSWEQFSRWQ
jgi:hypothetical protein